MTISIGSNGHLPEAMIELSTRNDAVTLEYNDTVFLLFTPDDESDPINESEGEFIRDNVTVYIIDNDRK